jgi:carboxypeptidase Taq
VDDSFLIGNWDKEKLRSFAERTASKIGFDFDRGRLSVAANAFCTTIATDDIRMTTRPSEAMKGIVSSTLHEMGHGLYEQGSPKKWDRTPLAGGVSLAVHESQSRLWENIVGRSRPFWEFFLPDLKVEFPELSQISLDTFVKAINKVQPEFVRVGADELTYNLHILVRFELEVEILTGKVRIKDLPEAWNAKYTDYLGITPATDTEGCLQDVHWTRGSVGYFPTYSMGNLIGAQVWKVLQNDLGETDEMMRQGNFAPIFGWLTDKIYSKGRSVPPRDLVTQVTGRPMEAADWLDYARAKYVAS